jgi:CDP-diacylglycerol--glycerol-3-phosphate 3-phosphatidyltransferase
MRMVSRPSDPCDIPSPLDPRSLNLPNAITLSRLLLALVLFVLIDVDGWWRTAAVVFVLAAFTDFLDGYLARRYGQVTILGRILDPFVDKIIICGAFIFLLKYAASGVTAWMTVVIIGREMFVTSLRAVLESVGQDFSAKLSGKIKMALQCVAVPLALLSLSPEFRESLPDRLSPAEFDRLRDLVLWLTVAVTVYSGLEYTVRGFLRLRGTADQEGPTPGTRWT